MAVASGSTGVDACVVLGDAQDLTEPDAAVLTDFAGASGVVVHVGDARGTISASVSP
jgi:hypothetical protein